MTENPSTYEEYKQAHFKERGRRVSLTMQEKARKGELPGPAPLGYMTRRSAEGRSVEIDESVAPLIRRAFEMAAQDGMSLRKILKTLTEEGLRSRNGKPLGVSALWYLLTNPAYVGLVKYREEILIGKHPAIVSKELFGRSHKKLQERKKLLPN